MRLYKYRGIPVIESNFLLAWNKNARGFAALYFIVHKVPEWDAKGSFVFGGDPFQEVVCSDNGCKILEAILKHEYKHIEQMRKHGRIKFVWKYFTDTDFHKQQEEEARRAEHE